MNNGLETRYFLSALTGAGYYALHRQFLRPPERYFCILKGGPGCGKSTFLRCLNRLEEVSDAYDELRKALDMDPSLKQVAHADGDVNDLLLDSKDNH